MKDLLLKTKRQLNLEATQLTFHSRTSFQMQFNPVQNETKSKTANKSISIATEIETIKMITTNLRTYTLHENRHTHTNQKCSTSKLFISESESYFNFRHFPPPSLSLSLYYISLNRSHTHFPNVNDTQLIKFVYLYIDRVPPKKFVFHEINGIVTYRVTFVRKKI